MYHLTNKHYKKYKNVDTIYYVFSENIKDTYQYDKQKNILYIKGKETFLPGILQKTIKAFEYVPYLGKNYDYIVRTNISTIVNFDKLSKELIKDPVDYGGPRTTLITLEWRDEKSGIKDDRYKGIRFISGICIIFSKELFQKLLQKVNLFNYNVIDDVSIAEFIKKHLTEYKPKVFNREKYIQTTEDNFKKINVDNYIVFRNKTINNRDKDNEIIEYITNKL